MLSYDYLTTSYFVYLENCIRALQLKYSIGGENSDSVSRVGTSSRNHSRSRSKSKTKKILKRKGSIDESARQGKIYSVYRDNICGNFYRIEYEILYPVSF